MLGYTFTLATETIKSQEFRTEVLKIILEVYKTRQSSFGDDHDYYKIAKCQFHLNLPTNTAELLEKLITSEKENEYLVAYQIAFDVVEKESQTYTNTIKSTLAARAD